MINAKIFEVLKTFSKEDFIKFGELVNSDYFNKSEMIRQLYGAIQSFAPSLEDKKLTREYLFEKLYPGKKFREGTIVNLLSGLYKLSEEFIATEMFRSEEYTQQRYIIRGFGKRNLEKFLHKNYTDMMNELSASKIQDDIYFNTQYELVQDYISYSNSEGPFIATEIIQKWHDKFIDFTVIKLLEGYVFMINHKKYGYEHNFNMTFMEPLIRYISENSFSHAPAILIYYNVMMLLKEDDERYYWKLKELVLQYPEIMKNSDRWTAYLCMVNFCQTRYDTLSVREKYSKEIHELYRTIIDKEIYKVEAWYPFLHHRLYINIVQNGLNQGQNEWTENFINNYKDELTEEYKTSTFNLCYALYYFSIRDFEKTLVCLSKVQTEDPFYFLQIKALTLQVYYELKLYDNAISLMDTYRHYLKEKPEIPASYSARHRNFLSVINRLMKIRLGSAVYRDSDFDLNQDEFKSILKLDWLMEKIKEVKN